jgi:hypothetical protein
MALWLSEKLLHNQIVDASTKSYVSVLLKYMDAIHLNKVDDRNI